LYNFTKNIICPIFGRFIWSPLKKKTIYQQLNFQPSKHIWT
jgi:hypothetical protein